MFIRLTTILFLLVMTACSGSGDMGGTSPAPPLTPDIPSADPLPDNPTPPADPSPASPDEKIPVPDSTSTAPYLFDATTRSLAKTVVDSRYADILIHCALMVREDESCTFGQLPLLGMEMRAEAPTIDEIMTRVVVTHDWMGVRFRELLELMPQEVLLMMRGITGIVISSEIRPSYYWARTGAMYLDADGMWLTEEERAVITQAEDPRTQDIQQFKFLLLWRYVKNDTDIRALTRSLPTIRLRTAALLFHELAHANDFFPPDRVATHLLTIPLYNNIAVSQLPSASLAANLPLHSSMMRSLAHAAFMGGSPSAMQLAFTADDVAAEFPLDVANDYYNYSTNREDLAMAFEEAMMLHTLGVARDVAAVDYPPDVTECDQLVVSWGQRTRIAEPPIGARSVFAVERILPEAATAISAMVDALPAPRSMTPGVGWCTNITVDQQPSPALSLRNSVPLPVEGYVESLVPYL